jgi:PKD domain
MQMKRFALMVIAATSVSLSLGGVTAPSAEAASCSTPTISGTQRVGNTLTGNSACTTTLGSVSFRWHVCDAADPSTCGGAVQTGDGSSPLQHPVVAGDRGKYLMFRAHAEDALGANPDTERLFTGRIRGQPPTAAFIANPSVLKRGATVFVNGSASSDPDGEPLNYDWDLDSNGTYERDTGSVPTTTTSFSTGGTKTIRLRVTDTDGDATTASRTVTVKRPPSASFVFRPGSPVAGDEVAFTSTSTDADRDTISYAWDLDGDGAFDDGNTQVVRMTYARAGSYTVTLRVTADGETSTVFRTVDVAPQSTPRTRLRLLRPFPRVAIGGFIVGRGVRLTLLSVRAPRGSRVMVKCRGRGCPRRTTRARVGRRRTKAFRSFRRRFRSGAVIAVYVWKRNRIGKYTRFRIRRGRRPSRRDRCLHPTRLRPMRCP